MSKVPATPTLRHRGSRRCRARRGATMVETAIILMVFLVMVFGMIDLGMTVLHYNLTTQAARQLARLASVHGEMAPPQLSQWGPATYTRTGIPAVDDGDEVAKLVRPHLTGLDPAETTLTLEWPDGNVNPESRVRATVSTKRQPFITLVFGNRTWTLTSSVTVQISH